MATQGDIKTFAGPLSKSRLVEKTRSRPFLLRNLELVLDSHEIDVNNPKQSATEAFKRHRKSCLNRKSWTPPTPAELIMAKAKDSQTLRINLEGIQRNQPSSLKSAQTKTQVSGGGRYGTRKKYKIIDVPCTVEVNIWAGQTNNKSIYRERRAARLLGHKHSTTENNIHFDIELIEGPFLIQETNLEDLLQGKTKYARGIAGKFSVAIRLHFKNVDDSMEAISWIDSRAGKDGDGDWTVLEARWEKLPQCPDLGERILLRMTDEVKLHKASREKDEGWKDTQSSLLIDMGWRNEMAQSPLTRANRVRQRARVEQLPSPPASDHIPSASPPTAKVAKRNIKIEWVLTDKVVETTALRCPLCVKRYFKDLDRLRMHMAGHHSNDGECYYIQHESEQRIKISVGFEKTDDNGEPLRKEEEEYWIRSSDAAAMKALVRKSWKDGPQRVKGKRKGKRVLAPAEPIIHPTMIDTRDLREIKPIPEIPRKRYPVPHLEFKGRNLQVFTTKDRRPVYEGDLLSESDDEPDDSYLKAKREAIYQSLPPHITEVQKKFMRGWDDHMAKENLNGIRYLGDAIFRWLKTPAAEDLFKDQEVQMEFEKKLEELRRPGHVLIDKTVYEYCLKRSRSLAGRVVEEGENAEAEAGAAEVHEDHDHTTTQHSAASARTPAATTATTKEKPAPKPRIPGRCICGETPTDFINFVMCTNDDCDYPDYHISCTDITDKKQRADWLCPDCRAADPEPAATALPVPVQLSTSKTTTASASASTSASASAPQATKTTSKAASSAAQAPMAPGSKRRRGGDGEDEEGAEESVKRIKLNMK